MTADATTRLRRKLFQAIDRLDDVLFRRARIDGAEAKRTHAFERRGSAEGESVSQHFFNESRLQHVVFAKTERDDRHFSGRKNFAIGPAPQFFLREFSQLESSRNGIAKRSEQ